MDVLLMSLLIAGVCGVLAGLTFEKETGGLFIWTGAAFVLVSYNLMWGGGYFSYSHPAWVWGVIAADLGLAAWAAYRFGRAASFVARYAPPPEN